ncbi:protein trichome birefringence [Humulus lupulus]|uniref:protein trichome birefringence n=1 Tax=Humulus lupulus TaxID=3486 RepID=UPI002B409E4D|nr:protein trichome birefringence [Humulus lupulus]
MADTAKHVPVHGGTMVSDLRSLFSIIKPRRTFAFLFGFMLAFVVFTGFLVFNPSPNSGAPWFSNVFSVNTPTPTRSSSDSSGSQFSSVFSYFFPNNYSSEEIYKISPPPPPPPLHPPPYIETNITRSINATLSSPVVNLETPNSENSTQNSTKPRNPEISTKNQTSVGPSSNASSPSSGHKNQTQFPDNAVEKNPSQPTTATLENPSAAKNQSVSAPKPEKNSGKDEKKSSDPSSSSGEMSQKGGVLNNTASSPPSFGEKKNNESSKSSGEQAKKIDIVESLKGCDFSDGEWVKDENRKAYYKPESCSVIDEQFNCVVNGRPDRDYQKFKWKPKGCHLPRLDGKNMLEMLRGRRLVFVGDSLNRNMWESLICILKNSAKNPKNVFEAHGRHRFRGEAEYSFVFKDYDCTVEFFVAPFLVQEWEMKNKNGTKRETLRLDLVGKSFEHFKTADIIVFNTGHWWTHDKTSKGEDYYQEGSHVYKELNVLEAFRKAITTWGRWIDGNVNPKKSLVFFRGYSHSHFSGGQWNSGGACDSETVPISDEKYLRPYPPKMTVLEKVFKGMKTPVTYLNVTRLTDFRKDGHPSIYRKKKLSAQERSSPLLYQDCSHWCLPGVPDAWNELLYAELLVKLSQLQKQKKT